MADPIVEEIRALLAAKKGWIGFVQADALLAAYDDLAVEHQTETQRADENFASYERVKEQYSALAVEHRRVREAATRFLDEYRDGPAFVAKELRAALASPPRNETK